MIVFKRKPICEMCGEAKAIEFNFFLSTNGETKCHFACGSLLEPEMYSITIERFFQSPAHTINWLAHLSEKNWFDPDNFFEMMTRFRQATNSFGGGRG